MAVVKKKDGRAGNGGPRPKTRKTDRRGAHPGDAGQAEFIPTEEQRLYVRENSRVFTHPIIAEKMGISNATLYRHFREELNMGAEDISSVAQSQLIKGIREGNMTAIIWWEKSRRGMSSQVALTGPDGKPLVPSDDMAKLLGTKERTDDELEILRKAFEILTPGSTGESGAGA